jgi:hypothetical protein
MPDHDEQFNEGNNPWHDRCTRFARLVCFGVRKACFWSELVIAKVGVSDPSNCRNFQ